MSSSKPIRTSRVPASADRSSRLRLEVLEQRALLTLAISGNGNTDTASLIAADGPGEFGTIGFDNVGESSTHNASVTYLGNRWCLTADHVSIDNSLGLVRFAGQSYTVDMSTITHLKNTDNKPTDLQVFRLTTDPGLPSELDLAWILPSQIVSSTPTGRQIMIGNGLNIGDLHFWHADTSQNPWVWSTQSPPIVPDTDDYKGYDIDTGNRDIRWSENDFEQTLTLEDSAIRIIGYLTEFDDLLYTLEASRDSEGQASSGDSGGAVFTEEAGQWKLGGIMVTVSSPRSGQPSNTTMFGDGTFMVDLSQYRNQILAATGSVAARQLFYKGSTKWNVTNNNLPGFSDDNAIAPDKTAYLPGSGTSAFSSVSSYSHGINGLMVDLYSQHGTITANDFIFKVGNNNSPATWTTAPAPTVTTRAGAGVEGTDRVELMWADGAIAGTWLEVIVRGNDALGSSNTNTGLRASDVFYFGSAPGDSGAADAAAFSVTPSDEISARNDPHGIGDPATISNVNDFDRDGLVNSSDQIFARNNGTGLGNQLKFLVVGASGPFGPDSSPAASGASTTASSDGAGGTEAGGDAGLSTALTISTAPAAGASTPGATASSVSPNSIPPTQRPIVTHFQHLEEASRLSNEVHMASLDDTPEPWVLDDDLLNALVERWGQ